MSATVNYYELSLEADQDIEEIFEYTDREFGFYQALKYTEQFEDVFNQLVNNPELGRKRPEIRKELRSFISGQHIIFYRILDDHIRIVRILHVRRDLPSLFE